MKIPNKQLIMIQVLITCDTILIFHILVFFSPFYLPQLLPHTKAILWHTLRMRYIFFRFQLSAFDILTPFERLLFCFFCPFAVSFHSLQL